jgi:phytoene desaturase
LKKDGFTFDMGPSWYWMPDVFDRFFADFGKKTTDYYELQAISRLSSILSCLGVNLIYYTADLAEIEATLNPLKKEAAHENAKTLYNFLVI